MTALLSVAQAAQLAACTRRYILDEIERWQRGENGLPAEKIGNQYAIRREDFDKWMAKPKRGTKRKMNTIITYTDGTVALKRRTIVHRGIEIEIRVWAGERVAVSGVLPNGEIIGYYSGPWEGTRYAEHKVIVASVLDAVRRVTREVAERK